MAALTVKATADRHPCGYTPSKGFNDIPLFSGARGQDLLPWLQLFRSRANLLHTPAEDIARELCLKLEGAALQSYSQGFAADASPTFAAVAAHLSKDFIKPYQGAGRWSAFFRFRRAPGSSGKEVKQLLHNARQGCLDDGIPLDDLSPAEHLYYIYQLSLSPAQSAQFLATLSSNPLASDDYMRALTPAGELAADRRASVAGPKGSAARTALFQLRVALIEAFLDHDNGEAARAAVTTAVTPDTAGPGTGGTGSTLPPPEIEPSVMECRLRVARADRADAPLPPPEYFGLNSEPKHAKANKVEFGKRKATGACFACLNTQVQYNVSHLGCPRHGRLATEAQRADPAWRVKGAAMPGRRWSTPRSGGGGLRS